MEFQNAGINMEALPRAASLPLLPIDPRYRGVLWRQWLIGWGILLLVITLLFIFIEEWHKTLLIVIAGSAFFAMAGINWFLVARSFPFKAYAVREHDIIYQTGWLLRSVRICPMNRIQYCSVTAGLLERKAGLATLHVYTAGGNEADMKIPGLPEETAAALRELVIQKTGAHDKSL